MPTPQANADKNGLLLLSLDASFLLSLRCSPTHQANADKNRLLLLSLVADNDFSHNFVQFLLDRNPCDIHITIEITKNIRSNNNRDYNSNCNNKNKSNNNNNNDMYIYILKNN